MREFVQSGTGSRRLTKQPAKCHVTSAETLLGRFPSPPSREIIDPPDSVKHLSITTVYQLCQRSLSIRWLPKDCFFEDIKIFKIKCSMGKGVCKGCDGQLRSCSLAGNNEFLLCHPHCWARFCLPLSKQWLELDRRNPIFAASENDFYR